LNGAGTHVLVEIGPEAPRDAFIDYLLRLGCTVTDRGGVFAVCVRFPDTVEDEAVALAEWCASWSRAHASRCIVHDSDVDGLRTTGSARSD
jgi:hypothetical protein